MTKLAARYQEPSIYRVWPVTTYPRPEDALEAATRHARAMSWVTALGKRGAPVVRLSPDGRHWQTRIPVRRG